MQTLHSIVVLGVVLAIAQPASQAGDARNTLTRVAKALGAENLKTLHYSGTGSSYVVTQESLPPAGWPHRVMKSYVRDLNLQAITSRLQIARTDGVAGSAETVSHAVDTNSPWDLQYEFWITPHGFLKAAMAYSPTMESKTVQGTSYRVVTVMLPGNHKIIGYINDKDLIDTVETWVGDRQVEASYRDYRDIDGVAVPMMITEKHAGHLSLILIVKDVKVGL